MVASCCGVLGFCGNSKWSGLVDIVAGSFRSVMVAGRQGFSICDPRAGEAI